MSRLPAEPEFFHLACRTIRWLPNGRLFAMLAGDNSGGESKHYLEPWYFVYDVEKKAFVWDVSLRELDKDAFVTEQR